MNTFNSWLITHRWIFVVLIPQFIVLFTTAPKGSSIFDKLKKILELGAIIDHQFTGLKLPLLTSARSSKIFSRKKKVSLPPPTPPAVALVLVGLLSLVACSFFSTKPATPEAPGIISCTEHKVADTAISILGKVATALISSDYEAALGQIAIEIPASIAQAAIACAVQQNVAHAQAAKMTAPGDNIAATIETNGNAWLSKHNIQFAK